MFCKQCGTQIVQEERFCPNCGTAVEQPGAPQQQNAPNSPPVSGDGAGNQDLNPYFTPAAPKKRHTKAIVAAVAILAAAAIAVIVTVRVVTKRPLGALAAGAAHLSDELKEMESCHLELSLNEDGDVTGAFDFEVNADDQELYLYGTLETMGEEIQLALYADGNSGGYAVGNDGTVIYADEISGVQLDAIWDAYDTKQVEDFSLSEYLEESGYEEEIAEYIDPDKIDAVYGNLVKRLSKRSTQKDLEQALAIETDRKSGERIYTVTIEADAIVDTVDLCLDIFEEEADDAIRGDWLDEARDALQDEIDDSEEYGQLEWRTHSGNLTELSFSTFYEIDMEITVDCNYDGDDLDEVAFSMAYGDGWNDSQIEITLDHFNQVDDVKSMIPDTMMEQMGSDSIL